MEGVGSRQHHHPPPQQKDRAGGRGKIRRKNERKDDSRSEYHDMAGKDTRENINMAGKDTRERKESPVEIRSMKDEPIATFHVVDMVNSLKVTAH